MTYRRITFLLSTMLALSFFSACGGGGGNNTVLTITPPGPTIVLKSDTLAYSASRTDVTWSVQGGDSNGTITSAGVYTPPTTLPTTSPKVLVEADSSDGQVATSEVDLRTGPSLTFGSPVPINDAPISGAAIFLSLLQAGVGDHIAVRLGTVNEVAAFAGNNSSAINPFFSQEIDFGGFSSPLNLNSSTTLNSAPCSIVEDQNENPGVFLVADGTSNPRIFFTSNSGAGFNAPQQIFPDTVVPANFEQTLAFSRFDDQGTLHVTFSQQDQVLANQPKDIFYSQSTDGGATWSNPKKVSASASSETAQFSSLAVGPNGNIYVTWYDTVSTNNNILFSRSVDGGNTFSTPIPLTSSGNATEPKVAVGPLGEVYIAYGDGDGTPANTNIFLVKSTDGGQNFSSPPLQVNSDPINNTASSFPNITVDSLGRVDVVWGADPNSSGDLDTLMYSRSVNGGGVFSPNQPIASGPSGTSSTGTFFFPYGMRHDAAGRLYVSYLIGNINSNFDFDVIHAE